MKTAIASLALALTMGCKDDKATTNSADSGEAQPAPYLSDKEEIIVPSTSASEIAASIDAAIDEAFALDAAPAFDAYQAAIAGMDDDCPLWTTGDGVPYWYSTCTTEDGTDFDGYGAFIEYVNYDDGYGNIYDGAQLYSFATVTTPDGTTFKGSGTVTDLRGTSADGSTFEYMQIDGAFSWDGPEAEGTWMGSDLFPEISMVASTGIDGTRNISIDGALNGLPGGGAVVFQKFSAYIGAYPDGCDPEPSGSMSVLDADGNWFDLQFNGPGDEAWMDPVAGCDGCAQAWYRGIDMGTVCPAFGPLWTWSGSSPW